jgi:hypothetical protein
MVERDVVSWVVDIGTIVGILVAVVMAARAIGDSKQTAAALAEARRLLEAGQERADREQAARVLTVGEDLDRRMRLFWQPTIVELEAPPTTGGANGLLRQAREDLVIAEDLVIRASDVDLTAVQYARYTRWSLGEIVEALENVERTAIAASPNRGALPANVQRHYDEWARTRLELIGRAAEVSEVLHRLEAHFPLAARLLGETDTQGFVQELHRELKERREVRIISVMREFAAKAPSGDPPGEVQPAPEMPPPAPGITLGEAPVRGPGTR